MPKVGAALADCSADFVGQASIGKTTVIQIRRFQCPKLLRSIKKPMLVNGSITDGKDAELIFDNEAGDAAVVGRPLFAHPDWPHIIRSGIPYN